MKVSIFSLRKFIHILLFIILIGLQFHLYNLWNQEKKNKQSITQSIRKLDQPNVALKLVNKASNTFLNVENNFNKYLNTYDSLDFVRYQISLRRLSRLFDSLGSLANRDANYRIILNKKKETSKEMISIKMQFDKLISTNLTDSIKTIIAPIDKMEKLEISSPISIEYLRREAEEKYQQQQVNLLLQQLEHQILQQQEMLEEENQSKREIKQSRRATIKAQKAIEDIKKSIAANRNLQKLNSPIIPISGSRNTAINPKELLVTIKYSDKIVTAPLFDQINNIAHATDSHYRNTLENIKQTYSDLREKDRNLSAINDTILKKSNDILSYYLNAAYELSSAKQRRILASYERDAKDQNSYIVNILIAFGAITVVLLAYTLLGLFYESKIRRSNVDMKSSSLIKDKVLGYISHELRTPLNIIEEYSKKLNTKNLTEEDKEIVNSILISSDSISHTVNQVLDFLRKSNTSLSLFLKNFNLHKEINLITQSLSILAVRKKLSLINQNLVPEDLVINGDIGKLHQLMYNLINNCIKFTDEGEIRVTTSITQEGEKHLFKIQITDTGQGIVPEDIQNIFEKYYQGSNIHNKKALGVGLGLNICKEIAELQGGSIKVESTVGVGSKFMVDVYYDKEDKDDVAVFSYDLDILIVDDDPFIRGILSTLLKNKNRGKIDMFSSAEEAFIFLKHHPVDLIITDIELPGISGIDFCKKVRDSGSINYNKPVIGMTANINYKPEDDDTDFIRVLYKPIDFYQLYVVLTLIQGKKNEQNILV